MSQGWSRLRDVDALADSGASFDFEIPVASLPRLRQDLASDAGEARGSVRFAREQGIASAALEYSATVELTCQRCLGVMRQQLSGAGHVLLVENEAEAGRVPEDETMLVPERKVRIVDVVEEELLLALPAVARHANAGDCGLAPEQVITEETPADAEVAQRPFAGLEELMRRGERRRGD